MPKGIIWVSSQLSHPPADQKHPGVPALTAERFCEWYENTHIYEVTALSGVPGAVRWEAAHPPPSPIAWTSSAPWLTVYEMPDIDYRNTTEFKTLDGQSPPKDALLHEIFEQARFDTRFYSEISSSPRSSVTPAAEHAKYLISYSTSDPGGAARLFENVEGVGRVRAYEVQAGTTLERFVRRNAVGGGGVEKGLVLVEFGEGAVEGVKGVVEGRGQGWEGEVGRFVRKRGYGDQE